MYSEKIKTVDGVLGTQSLIKGFFKGVLISAVFTVIVFAVAALVLAYTKVSENAIPVISLVVEMLGALISGYCTARESGIRGFLTGLLAGVVYILIIWIIAALVGSGFYFGNHFFTMLGLSALGGAAGGVLGVNLKSGKSNKRKRKI